MIDRALVMSQKRDGAARLGRHRGGMPMINRRSFLLGSVAALAFSSAARSADAVRPSRLRRVDAAALSAPIEIIDDPYGVPHIRAGSIPDAFFGQGYVVARD